MLGSARGGVKVTGVTTPSRQDIIAQCKRAAERGGWVKGVKGDDFKTAMNRERLREEVRKMNQGGDVGKGKQALANCIPEQVKTHVHRLELCWTDSSISKTKSTGFACVTQYVALKRSTEKRMGREDHVGDVGKVHTTS